MGAAQRIRRFGFRKWYERELIQSHVHLVLLILSTLGLLGSVETFGLADNASSQFTVLAAGFVSAVIGYWALRRYLYYLAHAEYVADQAVCKGCDSYGRFDAVEDDTPNRRLRVRCRRCEHAWDISL